MFATSQPYGNYITIDIITSELVRNILMALSVVFICTLILIANFVTSFIVLVTVFFTIINVAGFSYFWGLTIDTTFAIFMTISIGLCVDYSAHIAHGFMVEEGSRNERMEKTLVNIGPAVLNGGISTFVAFMLLSMSKSKAFFTFFQIFFLVVVFGLYHGLLFLPVIMSLIGPKSHEAHPDPAITAVEAWPEKQAAATPLKRKMVGSVAQLNGGFVPDKQVEVKPLTSLQSSKQEKEESVAASQQKQPSPPPKTSSASLPGPVEEQNEEERVEAVKDPETQTARVDPEPATVLELLEERVGEADTEMEKKLEPDPEPMEAVAAEQISRPVEQDDGTVELPGVVADSEN